MRHSGKAFDNEEQSTDKPRLGLAPGRQIALSAAGLLLSAAAPDLHAQEPSASGSPALVLEEVIVQARRRVENVQNVPIAVTAFSGDSLKELGSQRLEDIDAYTPGLAIDGGTEGNGASFSSAIFIRGIGQYDWTITFEPGVGIYLDNVYYGRLTGNVLDLVDIADVEVLRGPQGTLFGKNAIGGALNIRSKRPSGDFGGFLNVEGGAYDEINLDGAFEVPLAESFSVRVAGSTHNRDGIGTRLTDGGDLGDINRDYVRGTALWEPNDRASVTVIADWSSLDEAPRPQKLLSVNPLFSGPPILNFWNGVVAPTVGDGTRTFDPSFLTDDEYDNYQGGLSLSQLDAWGLSLEGVFDIANNLTLTSITGYREYEANLWGDYDTTFLPYNGILTNDNQDQFSQELRLNGTALDDAFDWVAGLYYYREEIDQPLFLRFFQGLGFAEINQRAAQVSTSYAAFAHGIWNLSSVWALSLGLRYTSDHKDFDVSSEGVLTDPNTPPPSVELANFGTVLPPGSGFDRTFDDLAGEAGVQFRPREDLMLYASVRQGYKSGGFNNRSSQPLELTSFDNETVNAYEVGFKSGWFENRLLLNVAGYYNDYKDLQMTFVGPNPPGGGDPPNFVDNAGAVEIYGIEVESAAVVSDHVVLNGALAWAESNITELDSVITAQSLNKITLDNRLPKLPEWKISLGALFEYRISGVGTMSVRGDAIYTSENFAKIENFSETLMEEHVLVNGRLALVVEDGRWEFYAEGRNLTDERVITSGDELAEAQGFVVVNYSEPRTWRAGVTYKFGGG